MQGQAGGRGGSPRAGVNKKFLLNTVHGLKSHNKREEEEDCWRQHNLDQNKANKANGRSRSREACRRERRDNSTDAVHEAASPISEVDTRQFWAEQKRKAMTALSTPPVGAPLTVGRCKSRERARSDGSADGATLSDDDSKKKRRRKGEKKAKKKKKRKRERYNSGSSSRSSSDSEVDDESRLDGGKASDKGHRQRKRKKSKKDSSRKKSTT